jgi:hypothetical protein
MRYITYSLKAEGRRKKCGKHPAFRLELLRGGSGAEVRLYLTEKEKSYSCYSLFVVG